MSLSITEKNYSLAVLAVLNKYVGTPVRWGRTKKLKDRFEGTFVSVKYEANFRRGGGFDFLLQYNGKTDFQAATLKNMYNDYVDRIAQYKKAGFVSEQRRMALSFPKTTCCNFSTGNINCSISFAPSN